MGYLISVIVPVHNTAEYLPKCIDSIRNQSLGNIEIILVENKSDDASAALCDEYAILDSRIKVLHLSIANASVARNAGIDIASAPYIGFVDSDDYIDCNMYEELYNVMNRYNVDIVYSNFQTEYLNGRVDSLDNNSGCVYVRSSLEVLRDMMWDKLNCSSCTKLFKRKIFSNLKFPEDNIYEDRVVMHNWILQCNQIAWIDHVFYHYVERSNSICHVITPLNRYHYFMAEFSRIEFIENHLLFEGEELLEARNRLIRICFFTFEEYVNLTKPKWHQRNIKRMRDRLKKILQFPKSELEPFYHKRIMKIVYLWPIYYWRHFLCKTNGMA